MNSTAESSTLQPSLIHDRSEFNVLFVHSRLDDYGLTPTQFRIYCHLARRAGSGAAWPSIEGIARVCRLHPKTVRSSLRVLAHHRLLSRQPRPGRTDLFKLTPPSSWHPTTSVADGHQSSTPVSDSQDGPPKASHHHPSQTEPPEGNPLEGNPMKKESVPAQTNFCRDEDIYGSYPRKVGKPAALQAIRRAVVEHGADFIEERTKLFATTCNAETRFIPHPATWFNQQRYADDPATWRTAPSAPRSRPPGEARARISTRDFTNSTL